MKSVLNLFAPLAAIGLVVSLVSHIYSLFGLLGPLGDFSWIMHIGIIIVWIPAVIASQSLSRGVPSKDFWKAALQGCPPWMRYLTYFFFGYAIFNFALFFISAPSHPPSGPMPPSVVRGFSGHWMAFYCAAFSILYSKNRLSGQHKPTHSPSGHPISPIAKSCDTCGSHVGPGPLSPK